MSDDLRLRLSPTVQVARPSLVVRVKVLLATTVLRPLVALTSRPLMVVATPAPSLLLNSLPLLVRLNQFVATLPAENRVVVVCSRVGIIGNGKGD